MKTIAVTYTVTGYYHDIIEVDDDMTDEEVEAMCYDNFPPIEEYYVQVDRIGEDDDDDDEEA